MESLKTKRITAVSPPKVAMKVEMSFSVKIERIKRIPKNHKKIIKTWDISARGYF